MIGGHYLGSAYLGQGPFSALALVRKTVRALGVYVARSFAVGVRILKATGRGQG